VSIGVTTVFLGAIAQPFPHAGYVVLLFPAFGLGIAWTAVRMYLRWRRFGQLKLTLDPYPGSIGGEVGGWLQVPLRPKHLKDLQASISCEHMARPSGKRSNSSLVSVIWTQQANTRVEMAVHGARISFLTRTDAKLPESDGGIYGHHWQLQLESKASGLNRRFDLPVFKTSNQRVSRLALDAAPVISGRDEFPPDVVRVTQHDDALELYYPPSIRAGFTSPFVLVGLLFALLGAGFGFVAGDAVFALMLTPLGLTLLFIGLYQRLNALHVLIGPETVDCRSSIGPFSSHNAGPVSQLGEPWKAINTQSRSDGITTVYYDIKARVGSQTLTLGRGIEGQPLADGLLALISNHLGQRRR